MEHSKTDLAIYIILIIAVAVVLGKKALIVLLLVAIALTYVEKTKHYSRSTDVGGRLSSMHDEEPYYQNDISGPIDVYDSTEPYPLSDPQPAWPYRGEHKPVDCYGPPVALPDNIHKNIDDIVTDMAAKRARDRRAIDGLVTKTADYYRRHYGDELEQSEAKVWWGAKDY